MKRVQQLLDQIGIGGERIQMFNMSSAMGNAFAQAVTEMTAKVKALGPNPVSHKALPVLDSPQPE